jgi:hypothetical protein
MLRAPNSKRLAQLADGKGVLDHGYTEHLRECGYRI